MAKIKSKTGMKSLTAKQRSALAKQARAKKDIGKPGKAFSRVAEKAAKRYGSAEAGKRVAAASMMKARAKRLGKK